MSAKKSEKLVLVDGSGYIFRAFHGLPMMTRPDGTPINAVFGFTKMLLKLTEDLKPSHVVVIFDAGRVTFRNDIYPEYKANRSEPPEELVPQFPLVREAAKAMSLPVLEMPGFEADDLIASFARAAENQNMSCLIVSSDKDLMQLVRGSVSMLDPMKNRTIGVAEVIEKFGVGPDKVIDVQSLAGDSTDNVPGVPGIGIKTAAELINQFGDLDSLLAGAETIKQPKRREALIEFADQIRLSRQLVSLDDQVPLEITLDDLEVKDPEPETLMQFLAAMEFRSLTKRVADHLGVEAPEIQTSAAAPAPAGGAAPATPEFPAFDHGQYETITTLEALTPWLEAARAQGFIAIDTETTALDEMRAELVGVSLATKAGRACYIPLQHRAGGDDLFGSAALVEGQMPLATALDALRPVFEDEAIVKIGQNMKYDAKILARYGIKVAPIDDTMLMSYALHGGLHGHGMDALSARYLDHEPIPIKTLLGAGKAAITFDLVKIEDAAPYAAEDADITLRLWQVFKPQLHQVQVTRVYETLERPLVPVLARMEMAGVCVDRDVLSRMSNAFAQKMAALEAEAHELAGEAFNLASPKQIGEILFDKMGLEGGKKGKTGAYSTGADILEDLAAAGHELPARLLDWRQIAKLKSTYTDALQDHINPETGRVHTSYVIAGANTGRLASTDPNLQNIPIRSEEGRRIREAFVAPEGRVLVSLDYSQIELRILAEIAGIDALKQAFREGQDIHAATASEMFGIPLDQMTSDIRRQAKAINFGVIYGISGFGLARNLRIPRAEAQGFIDRYFERFPGIRDYMTATKEFAKSHRYVQTLFGRKIHTPDIEAKGPAAGFAQRAAINAPIQGTAADIIRRAMIRMDQAIADLPATMLLQVHDELVFEVDEGAVDALIARARDVMESAASPVLHLSVPLVVDAGQGKNWAEAH